MDRRKKALSSTSSSSTGTLRRRVASLHRSDRKGNRLGQSSELGKGRDRGKWRAHRPSRTWGGGGGRSPCVEEKKRFRV